MVDAGYLNPAGEIKGGAAELFFKHRDEIILEKVNAKDSESEAYDSLPREDFIRSRLEFPTFHLNWIDGILTSCLKILDFAGSVSAEFKPPQEPTGQLTGPIHDPMFVFAHVDAIQKMVVTKPTLGITDIIKYFAIPAPPGQPWPGAMDLGIKDPAPDAAVSGPESIKTAAFKAGMATITAAPQYKKRNPKDFIPLVPSDEFPNIDYPTGDQKELSLQSKQELLFTAVIDALDKLISDILAKPMDLLVIISNAGISPSPPKPSEGQQLPGPGLIAIFKAAELVLDKFLPDPKAAANDALTNIVNFEALKRLLIKPLYLTAIGVLFGSHPEGFTGLMGVVAPDAVKTFNEKNLDTKPEKLDLEINLEETQASAEPSRIGIGDLGTSRLLTTLSLEECSNRNQQRKNVDQFKFSTHALKWLVQKEGGVIKKIFDDGTGMMTVGLGHLLHSAKNVGGAKQFVAGTKFTDEQVYRYLVQDLYLKQNIVRTNVARVENGGPRLLFTQYEYDILVSWAFGFGYVPGPLIRAAQNSAPDTKRISPYWGAANAIMGWCKGTGIKNGETVTAEIPGMKLRRQMESILWELGDYDAYTYHQSAHHVQQAMFRGEEIKGAKLVHSKSKNNSYDLQDGDISEIDFNISTILPKLYAAEAAFEAQKAPITLNAKHDAGSIFKKDHGIPSSIV